MAALDLQDELAPVMRELQAIRAELAALAAARRAEPVSLEEAARHFGVSVRTMRRRVKTGEVPVVRLGRSVRVRLDDASPTR